MTQVGGGVDVTGVELFVLLVGATGVAWLARKARLSVPIVLVVVGLMVSYLPGVPDYRLEPELVLVVILPPLLYSAALDSSYLAMRAHLVKIGSLSVGLVLFSTVAVGMVVHLVVPSLPLAVSFALGAIVAPPDAVAAVAMARRMDLPRTMVTILVGESLFNDATALTVYRVAIAAVVGEGVSLLGGVGNFLLAAVGGVAVGLVLGPIIHWLRRRLHDTLVESALSLLVPFVAYLAAESFGASGVLAVVVVGLYLGHRSSQATFATRLQDDALWKMIDFLLEAIVFALIGLQLPSVLHGLREESAAALAGYAAAVLATMVLARFAWVYAAAYLPWWLRGRLDGRLKLRGAHRPSPRGSAVVSWAGMRGVVSMAAAVAIPVTAHGAPFPDRDLLVFLTMCAVLGTLLLQGVTFPALIRRMRVSGGAQAYRDDLAEADTQHRAARAASELLEEIATGEDAPPDHIVARLRALGEHRELGAWERLGGGTGPGGAETPSAAYRRVRRRMLAAERDTFVAMRDQRRIDDEVLRRVLRELDLEEAQIARE